MWASSPVEGSVRVWSNLSDQGSLPWWILWFLRRHTETCSSLNQESVIPENPRAPPWGMRSYPAKAVKVRFIVSQYLCSVSPEVVSQSAVPSSPFFQMQTQSLFSGRTFVSLEHQWWSAHLLLAANKTKQRHPHQISKTERTRTMAQQFGEIAKFQNCKNQKRKYYVVTTLLKLLKINYGLNNYQYSPHFMTPFKFG